jgi:hypothetical protein
MAICGFWRTAPQKTTRREVSISSVGKVSIVKERTSVFLTITASRELGKSGLKMEDARVTSSPSRLRIMSPSWKPDTWPAYGLATTKTCRNSELSIWLAHS